MLRCGLASDGVYICPSRCREGGSLLHCPSTLTDLMSAVHFCCTVLGVTSTGCYPAPCPVKPGLSSSGTFRPASRDHLSYLSLFNCKILSYYRLSVNPFFTSSEYSQSIPAALLTEPSFATCKMIIFLLQIKAAAPDKFPDQGIVRNVIPRNRQKIIKEFQQALRLLILRLFRADGKQLRLRIEL